MDTHETVVSRRLRTVDQLADDLSVSRWQVYRLVRSGQLRAVKVGERLRFRDTDVERYLERDGEPAP
jgi:excisionase family DNA binding protein